MKKVILTALLMTGLFLASCGTNKKETDTTTTDSISTDTAPATNDTVSTTTDTIRTTDTVQPPQ